MGEPLTSLPTNHQGLISRYANGDAQAAEELYDRFAGAIFAIAYRTLGNRDLAEDAVQQTFLQAFRGAATFDETRPVSPWIYSIARRAAIDIYRKERRHEHSGETDIAIFPPGFEHAWEVWKVRQAVDALPEDERATVHATHFLGMTHTQAAQELGIPVGTVKSRAHRAYRLLANSLQQLREGEA